MWASVPSLDHCLLYWLLCVSRSHIDGRLQLLLRMLVFPNWGSKSFSVWVAKNCGQDPAKPLIYVQIPLIYSCTSDLIHSCTSDLFSSSQIWFIDGFLSSPPKLKTMSSVYGGVEPLITPWAVACCHRSSKQLDQLEVRSVEMLSQERNRFEMWTFS